MADNGNVVDFATRSSKAKEFDELSKTLTALAHAVEEAFGHHAWSAGDIICLLERLEAQGFTISRKEPKP
jgi:hypothetical protein